MGMLFYILSAEFLVVVFLYFRYLPHFLKFPLDSLPVWPHRYVPLPGRGRHFGFNCLLNPELLHSWCSFYLSFFPPHEFFSDLVILECPLKFQNFRMRFQMPSSYTCEIYWLVAFPIGWVVGRPVILGRVNRLLTSICIFLCHLIWYLVFPVLVMVVVQLLELSWSWGSLLLVCWLSLRTHLPYDALFLPQCREWSGLALLEKPEVSLLSGEEFKGSHWAQLSCLL